MSEKVKMFNKSLNVTVSVRKRSQTLMKSIGRFSLGAKNGSASRDVPKKKDPKSETKKISPRQSKKDLSRNRVNLVRRQKAVMQNFEEIFENLYQEVIVEDMTSLDDDFERIVLGAINPTQFPP